jgi:hypothetical protein
MATSIVHACASKGATPEETLATVLCGIAISTAMLGVALMITGWLRLAALVQYLPLPVIGGYLAFIGFCEFLFYFVLNIRFVCDKIFFCKITFLFNVFHKEPFFVPLVSLPICADALIALHIITLCVILFG